MTERMSGRRRRGQHLDPALRPRHSSSVSLTLSAERKTALEIRQPSDRLLGCAFAVFVPCKESRKVLDGTVRLVPTDSRRPEAKLRKRRTGLSQVRQCEFWLTSLRTHRLAEIWVKDHLLES